MGQKIKILVYWDDVKDAPTAADVSIPLMDGEAKIEWIPDESVAGITSIEGLAAPEFIDVKRAGRKWKGTDCCTKKGIWDYVIVGKKAGSTRERAADPKIRNDDNE